jgi:hypothetical protein
MRKKCLTRVRSRGTLIRNAYNCMVRHFAYTQDSTDWEKWNYRSISQRSAEILAKDGLAERVTRRVDGVVQTVGYKALQPTSWEKPSPATLTFGTMQAVGYHTTAANKCDPKYRMTRGERDHVIKFRVWPLVGDTKAVAVRPPMTPIERHFAEQLLKNGGRMSRVA